MLTIAKIHSQRSQAKGRSAAGYLHYLGEPAPKERGFEAYARGGDDGPPPLWACKGPALLGLGAVAEAEQIERLARGLHPATGAPLAQGAGASHVAGLDLTFSAPKDVSAVFAGADAQTRGDILEAMRGAARSALDFAEKAAVTRHGKGGLAKQAAQAGVAAMFQHFASRAGQPQLHIHALMFNLGKRAGLDEWSALEQRAQFEGGRKMATGALFRAELAHRLGALGFRIQAAGPYFAIEGVTAEQREALSARSREIDQRLREAGVDLKDSAARQAAALATRRSKAEPPLPELLESFRAQALELGITPESVRAMREPTLAPSQVAEPEPFAIDRAELLAELMESQSCATASEALAAVCQRAMGRWSAAECLAELDSFMRSKDVVSLGRTEYLSEVFTSKATLGLERLASERVEVGKADISHRAARELVDREFDALEADLRARLGVDVSLAQQRAAAVHLVVDTGTHALVEGWAGAGKTTLMRAAAKAWEAGGMEIRGCSQSASAAQSLSREAGIPSRTIASLLLALRENRAKLTSKTVLVLEESGTVGSREFSLLQEAVIAAGAKLVCVGDPKQLQPIAAGGICRSLARIHGKAEISNIQRQRTDFEPLLAWLEARARPDSPLDATKAAALRSLPEDARLPALEAVCALDPKLSRAFERWRSRFDYEWLRGAVEMFARGEAKAALDLLDSKGRLRLSPSRDAAIDALVSEWAADKTPVKRKAIVAATRAEVAELNARARAVLVERGVIDDALGVDVEIKRRDGTTDARRFAPGDRIVFTMNDRELGVANGAAGSVSAIERGVDGATLVVELDDPSARGERTVRAPASFGWLDNALCSTAHRSQGRTFDSAHVLANPSMSDREWIYVAASRSRFATTLHVDASALGLADPDSHAEQSKPTGREAAIEALANRMRRSRAKGTTLDFDAADISREDEAPRSEPDIKAWRGADISRSPTRDMSAATMELAKRFVERLRERMVRALALSRDPADREPRLQREPEPEREIELER